MFREKMGRVWGEKKNKGEKKYVVGSEERKAL